MEEAYDDFTLPEAIIYVAAEDYKETLLYLKKHPGNKAALREIQDLEDFFYSSEFEMITKINPDYLIRKMKEYVNAH